MKDSRIYNLARFYGQRLADLNWHQHPFFIPVTTFLVLFFAALSSFVLFNGQAVLSSDSRIVMLSHDEQRETIPTRTDTVADFLESIDVRLEEGDVVEPSADTPITEDNFRVNVYRARPMMINDEGDKKFVFSAATTPRSVANQAGVTVYPEDNLRTEMPFSTLKDGAIGETIVIDRATPAKLNLYGTLIDLRTHAETVGDLLAEKQVQLAEGDVVTPAPETQLTPQTQVFVTRNGTKVETVEEEIPFEVETIEDSTLSFGTTVVRQQGVSGKKFVTYEIQLTNNVESSRKVIQSVVASEPVTKIVARGKVVNIPADKEAVMSAAGIAAGDQAYVNYIVSRESGWNAGATNRSSGAYGLCQALPGGKMASAGGDWQTNPVTQLRWCSGYAVGRYGSWGAAYDFWIRNHWW
ncbi:hypothetical protein CR970_02660 [Candidatus Saccharibacteria bacterium]|nr:MAG: hypothetical protein CR970_02660 [Candidatus Saccharibacteria bacterium]